MVQADLHFGPHIGPHSILHIVKLEVYLSDLCAVGN